MQKSTVLTKIVLGEQSTQSTLLSMIDLHAMFTKFTYTCT